MTSKEITFTCAYCGKEYKVKKYNKRAKNHFCSLECRKKYQKEISPSRGISWKINNCKCNYCGKEFHKTPSDIKKLNFCSRKCQNTFLAHLVHDRAQQDLNCTCLNCGKKFHRKHSRAGKIQFCNIECKKTYEEKLRKKKEHLEICPICGKEFVAGIKRDKFCSIECQIAWQRRFYKEVRCSYCGKKITLDKTRQKCSKSGLFFCSNACIGKYYRGNRSPVYKGARSVLFVLRSYYERHQKRRAFAKYNSICQVCGNRAQHIHHIYPLHKIVDKYWKENNIKEEDTHERYLLAYKIIQEYPIFSDESNLIALCKKCHKEHHRKGAKTLNITNIDYGMSDNSYSIFVSGCKANPKCKGCFNPENWNFEEGRDWLNYIERIKKDLNEFKNLINKIIIVGGEPLDQDLVILKQMITFLKQFNTPIYLFTRFELEEVPKEILELADYIKCGAYIPELKTDHNVQYDIQLATSNQKIYKKGLDY